MTLRDLVYEAQRKRGTTSAAELARIAQGAGHKIVHTTVAQIRAGTYPSKPMKPTLKALAYLAGVPYARAHLAAGLSGPPDTPFADQLPRDVDHLTPRQRDAVLVIIRALLEAQQALEATRPAVADEVPNVAYVTDGDIDDPGKLSETGETI